MEIIDLSKNENPLGCSPLAIAGARQAITMINRYSDTQTDKFIEELSVLHNVGPEQILLGNGSSDLLNVIARTFLHKNDVALTTQCNFSEYQHITTNTGARLTFASNHLFEQAINAADTQPQVTWISNPNNPLGNLLNLQTMEQIAQCVNPGILVCDEAYIDFVDQPETHSAIKLLPNNDNLIITRTFSKMHGIAGLRLGYLIASPEVADKLSRIQVPMSVSAVAIAACSGALKDVDFVNRTRQHVKQTRNQIVQEFRQMDIPHKAGVCNFVCFEPDDAKALQRKLLDSGIRVKHLEQFGMPNHLRVSVGTERDTATFLHAIGALLPINSERK